MEYEDKSSPMSTGKPLNPEESEYTKGKTVNGTTLNTHSILRNPFSSSTSLSANCTTPTNIMDKSLKELNNFKMIGKVGEGAYGAVHNALHIPTQKVYAIKIIQKSRVEKVSKKY